MYLNPFHEKKKYIFFSDGKSRGPLLARAALKKQSHQNSALFSLFVAVIAKVKHIVSFFALNFGISL